MVDFGTATNIEIINKEGSVCRGHHCSWCRVLYEIVVRRAALLRSVELEDPGTAIGTNTAECMKVGIMYGEAARIDGLGRSRIQAAWDTEATVVAQVD